MGNNDSTPDGQRHVHDGEVKRAALQHVRSSFRLTEAHGADLIEMIIAAQDFGATWDDIAHMTGLSTQAAHNRFAEAVKAERAHQEKQQADAERKREQRREARRRKRHDEGDVSPSS